MLRVVPSGRSRVLAVAIALMMTGVVMVALGGCGGDDLTQDTKNTTASMATTSSTAVSATTSASSETTVPTTLPNEPVGEIGATVSVSSTNGAYPTENIPDWSQIKSVEAYRFASMGVASLFVSLATYDVSADSISEYSELPYPEAGQGRIELVLTRTVGGAEEPPLVPGTYDFNVAQGYAELTGDAAIVLTGGTRVTFAQGELESDVQITAVSDDLVSGTFYVKDKWSEISGTFTAPVK